MTNAHRTAKQIQHQTYFWVSLLAAIVLFAVSGIQFKGDIDDRKNERRSCERVDDLRAEFYGLTQDIVTASDDRLKVITDPAEKKVTEHNRDRYMERGKALIRSVGEFAEYPGSIHIDCSRAHPYPWPL